MKPMVVFPIILSIFFALPASAGCLDEVVKFANQVCGEIENRGSGNVIDARGNLTAKADSFVARIIGSGSANASAKIVKESYEGVVREQLGAELFNVRDCRQKMVDLAIRQICRGADEKPVAPLRDTRASPSMAIAPRSEFILSPRKSAFLTDENVIFTYTTPACGANTTMICVSAENEERYLSIGGSVKFPIKQGYCSVFLLEILPDRSAKFFLRC